MKHGADATVRLDEHDDLVEAFRDAFGGSGPSYVFDPLWGEPAAAAVDAAAPRATIVNLGQSAGAKAGLASAAVRFKSLSVLGHTNFAVPPGELAEEYRRLVQHAVAGDIRLELEEVPLESVAGGLAPSGRRRGHQARRRAVAPSFGVDASGNPLAKKGLCMRQSAGWRGSSASAASAARCASPAARPRAASITASISGSSAPRSQAASIVDRHE